MSWPKVLQFLHRLSPWHRTGLLVLLFFFSFGLLRYTQRAPATHAAHTTALPQEYMKMVALTTYDANGAIKNALFADYWAYSPQTEHSILNRPKLIVYKPDQTMWEIVAKQAKVSQPSIGAIASIALSKDVVLLQSTQSATPLVTVETQSLDYQPEKQYAETAQFVKMTKPALMITGIGLRAFLEKNWVELLHDVKTYYTGH
jgi:LPS export ABC transporter protein LptC